MSYVDKIVDLPYTINFPFFVSYMTAPFSSFTKTD